MAFSSSPVATQNIDLISFHGFVLYEAFIII